MKDLIESLNWRYATKKFDPSKKLDEKLFNTLTEAMRLSPSSYGLEPWKFLVIRNKDIRSKLSEAGNSQPQITDASHLLVLASKTNLDDALVDKYVKFVSKEKNVDLEHLAGFSRNLKGFLANKTAEEKECWASRQTYIALGLLLTSCAVLSVDACPMEGINNKKVDEILGLEKMNLKSLALVAIGYRADDDKYATNKKVRLPYEDVFIEVD